MTLPFALLPAGESPSFSTAAASPAPRAACIPLAAFNDHLRTHPAPHTCLPDGTPLFLTASGIDLFERLTGSFLPQDFHEATVLLWAATRTPAELEALWTPSPPEDVSDDAPSLPIMRLPELMHRVIRWRDATLPAGARLQVQSLAMKLWAHEHGTALEVDTASLPDVPDAEKKSPSAAPTGSSPPSMPSPQETSPAGLPCSTAPATAPFSPPTAHGSPPTASPSSPPPPPDAGTN